ncbi:ImpA family type VI secretion system protein [Variovorax sp. RHLX14]|uniref:type VI secretion system protein TssA n=1 Tax=Variovorax sp. RHLX14 TaxID=1259731 RepID=UPI003F472A72
MNDLSLLQPVDPALPCGPSLDYDPAHVLVMARLSRRTDAQYGTFVDTPGMRDWSGIAQDCESLLQRTRDIAIMVGWCRARLALAHAPGLEAALGSIRSVLERWPDDVHPQLHLDGLPEPTIRANAVAALADPDGLLGEIRDLVVIDSAAARLTVRAIERALTKSRAPDSALPEVVEQQLQDARADRQGDAAVQIRALDESAAHVRAIDAWSRAQLGDEAPSLARLLRLLTPFELVRDGLPPMEKPVKIPKAFLEKTQPAAAQKSPLARHDAAAGIRAAREWFEMHEPSSPVAVLLKQAERMVGQRFVQVADAIPLELLRQWDARGTESGE